MTYEELKTEANKLGYKLIKITEKEKLIPCICGYNRRDHTFSWVNGHDLYGLKCRNCGFHVESYHERSLNEIWNRAIRKARSEV